MKVKTYDILNLPNPLEIPGYPPGFLSLILDRDRTAVVYLYLVGDVLQLSSSRSSPTWHYLKSTTYTSSEPCLEIDAHYKLLAPFAEQEHGTKYVQGQYIFGGKLAIGPNAISVWSIRSHRAQEVFDYLNQNDPLSNTI